MEDKIFAIQELLDGRLDETSAKNLMKEIETYPELKEKYKELVQLDNFLQNSILPVEPRNNFTLKVMENLVQSTKASFNWKGLLLFLGISTTLIICSIFLYDSDIGGPATFNGFELPLVNQSIPSFSFNINFNIISNGLLLIGFFASMLFLDIIVLRPLFKKNAY